MSSEKWFDWDSSESKPAEESATTEPSADAPSEEAAIASDPPPEPLAALNIPDEATPRPEAARPYHLWITGVLRNHEKERLIELLTRENFGIREVDLDLQFEAQKILLPRISEFAAMLVAQTLRDANIELELHPSDFDPSKLESLPQATQASQKTHQLQADTNSHPAETLPITHESVIPGQETALPLDVLIATGMIAEPEWKAKSSDHYSLMIEALKRELRFKAHIKKADALVCFEIQILSTPWVSEKECRIQVRAQAIRFQQANQPS